MEADEHPRSVDQITLNLLHTLENSGAPRFLISIFELPPGDYVIPVDLPSLELHDQRGDLTVWEDDGERRAELRFVNTFSTDTATQMGLEPVYTHMVIRDGELFIGRGTDSTTPKIYELNAAISDLSDTLVLADFCDFASLPMDPAKAGGRPSEPIEANRETSHG